MIHLTDRILHSNRWMPFMSNAKSPTSHALRILHLIIDIPPPPPPRPALLGYLGLPTMMSVLDQHEHDGGDKVWANRDEGQAAEGDWIVAVNLAVASRQPVRRMGGGGSDRRSASQESHGPCARVSCDIAFGSF